MSGERDFGRGLYPFLYDDQAWASPSNELLLEEVRRSTIQKSQDVAQLRTRILAEYADTMVDAALAMARAFAAGGKLIAFGNGGSATDAQDAVIDCLVPP